MKILSYFLSIAVCIAFSQNANATDFCAPVIVNSQDLANQYCPSVCTAAGAAWNGNWSPTSNMSCGTGNPAKSVCGCNIIINSSDHCAPESLNSQVGANTDCPDTCTKVHGTWNGNWSGTSDLKCTGNNQYGSVCGCNYTGCSEIVLDYDHPDEDPPNWTASAWYTPCGANQEAGTSWAAKNWTDNRLSIATGTRIRIGPARTTTNFIDKVVTESEFHVFCRGTAGTSTSDDDPACCRDANIKYPRTNVLVTYEPGVTWTASISYTPWSDCAPLEETSEPISNVYGAKPISIASDTLVKIGPLWTKNEDYITQNMSGTEVKVICFGKILGQGSGCCVVGDPKCTHKSLSTNETQAKGKAHQKTPIEKKSPQKTQPTEKPAKKIPPEKKTSKNSEI